MIKKFLLSSIKFYKRHISNHTRPACRFTPTCSEYAYTAIERYGSIKGSILAIKRILRCNPLFKGGFDPVPEDELITIRRN